MSSPVSAPVSSNVSVVIPTKSNVAGLMSVLGDVLADHSVRHICVVIDGDDANRNVPALPVAVSRVVVPVGSGIQHMWNRGMATATSDTHIVFLNDDVRLDRDCLGSLARSLDADPTIGLICPNYSNVTMPADRDVFDTCRSRYDGTGGMAGFAMMLHRDLVRSWSFDENLRWWYGDDDIVRWITRTMKRRAVISASARCHHLDSVTINSDPPTDFGRLVEQDRMYFETKWNGDNESPS